MARGPATRASRRCARSSTTQPSATRPPWRSSSARLQFPRSASIDHCRVSRGGDRRPAYSARCSTWSGHRDHVLLTTVYNTGARVSDTIGVRVADPVLEPVAHVRLHGKGRKDRTVPLWRNTAKRLKEWLPRVKAGPDTPLFPNGRGVALSRSGVERRLRAAVTESGRSSCPHSRPTDLAAYLSALCRVPDYAERRAVRGGVGPEMAPETENARISLDIVSGLTGC